MSLDPTFNKNKKKYSEKHFQEKEILQNYFYRKNKNKSLFQ